MQILVTGGAGYIGSVVCEILQRAGYELVVIDDLRDGNRAAITPGTVFYGSCFSDSNTLDTIFSEHQIGMVVHLAASANVPDSVVNPLNYYENNMNGTVVLLKKMHQYGVRKIIFSSTAAVYGEPRFIPITEEHVKEPVNPYGFSKLFNEQVIKDCQAAYGLQYFIFRYFCAAGATALHGESRMHESHLIPLAIDTALGKKDTLKVFGNDFETADGSGVRDFIHVADIANAHLLAVRSNTWNHELNLGTGSGYSVFEIIAETETVTGKKINYEIAPARPGDPASLIASSDKAKQVIGWEPEYFLHDIIRSAAAWREDPLY